MAISSWSAGAVNETIGSGQDRTTLSAFEAAHDGETPTNGTLCTGAILGNITETVYWQGWQSGQNATTRIVVTATVGNETTGMNGAGNKARRTGTDFIFESVNPIYIDYTRIEITNPGNSLLFISGLVGQIRLARCLCHMSNSSAIQIANAQVTDIIIKIGGCILKNTGFAYYYGAAIHNNNINVTTPIEAFNNTIYFAQNGISELQGTIKARNCASANTNASDYDAVSDEDYNISEDATATGLNSLNNQVAVDLWTLPASDATGDFTIKDAASNLKDNGEQRLEVWFTELVPADMVGAAWSNPPSIGAFEFPGGGGQSIVPHITSAFKEVNR